MADSIRIVIVGAPGYTGAELATLLAAHPHVRVLCNYIDTSRQVPHIVKHNTLPTNIGQPRHILLVAP